MKKLEHDVFKYKNSIEILETLYKQGKVTLQEYDLVRDKNKTYSRQQLKTLYNVTFNQLKEQLNIPTIQYNNSFEKLLLEKPESYYWAGFLFADGWVHKNYTSIGLRLADKDIEHLNKYRAYIEYTGLQNKNQVDICSPYVKQFSDKFNIVENKSHRELNYSFYKTLPYNLWISWFIGYTDGDGSIISRPDRPNLVNIRYVASKDNLSFHQELLEDVKLRLGDCNSSIYCEKDTIIRWRLSKKSIARELKKQAMYLPCLDRKWSKINLYDMV
jgi:hypothetical protein